MGPQADYIGAASFGLRANDPRRPSKSQARSSRPEARSLFYERRVSTSSGSTGVIGEGVGGGVPAAAGFGMRISPRRKMANNAVTAVGSSRFPERFSMMRMAS